MPFPQSGASGPGVISLQQNLKAHGFDPGAIDGEFGPGTEAALIAFQKSENLLPDGIAGPAAAVALGLTGAETSTSGVASRVTVGMVAGMFPSTPIGNIRVNLPFVLTAQTEAGLDDKPMILMALATIRAETASFEPVDEGRSRFNTSPGGHPFDLYDRRKDLGNRGAPDGASYRGRGFVQLTGRANYTHYSLRLGLDATLVDHPASASDPAIAARLLALFLQDKERAIREALLDGDLRAARKLVNGGGHGLDGFIDAYRIGAKVIPG